MQIIRELSPNQSARPAGAIIRCVVLHATVSPKSSGTRSWIGSTKSAVSYHDDIDRDGTVFRFVELERKAWACGISSWRGIQNVNGFSISLAFENLNNGKELLTPEQIVTGHEMVREYRRLFPTIEEVTTHAVISPGRKFDPIKAPNFNLADFQ